MAIRARPFQRQLVIRIKIAPPRIISAKQGVITRSDDEFVACIIAAKGKYFTLLDRKDFTFADARRNDIEGFQIAGVANLSRLADVFDLGR